MLINNETRVNKHILHLGWFSGHFDGLLEDGDRKVWTGGRAEPQPKIRVWSLHLQLTHQFV